MNRCLLITIILYNSFPRARRTSPTEGKEKCNFFLLLNFAGCSFAPFLKAGRRRRRHRRRHRYYRRALAGPKFDTNASAAPFAYNDKYNIHTSPRENGAGERRRADENGARASVDGRKVVRVSMSE